MDESDVESSDSDRELQVAFAAGLIQPGLNIKADVKEKPKFVKNVPGLQESLKTLKNDLPWIERLDVTVTPAPPPKPMAEQLGENPDDLQNDVHNDFKREMRLLAQAAVFEAFPRLKSMGVPTKRPDDFFAEMAKTDQHMKKVREKLLSKQHAIEQSQKAKKLRDLKKYGKKVQQEVLQKRQKEKKQMMDAVKKFRKGQSDKLDFLDDEKLERNKGQSQPQKKKQFQPNKKRQLKNKKYGFGGQKKRSKQNTSESARDMSDYSAKKHGTVSIKFKRAKQGAKNRPGKNRRQKQKGSMNKRKK